MLRYFFGFWIWKKTTLQNIGEVKNEGFEIALKK